MLEPRRPFTVSASTLKFADGIITCSSLTCYWADYKQNSMWNSYESYCLQTYNPCLTNIDTPFESQHAATYAVDEYFISDK